MRVNLVAHLCKPPVENKEVVKNYYRVECSEIIDIAIDFANKGKGQKASRVLQIMINSLKKLPELNSSRSLKCLLRDLEFCKMVVESPNYEKVGNPCLYSLSRSIM